MIKNFLKTYDFANKTIYLIANNNNQNINKINNIQLDENSVIIRFNGDRLNLMDTNTILKNRCDIMVYRGKPKGFHGFNKTDIKGNIQVFAMWNDTLTKSKQNAFEYSLIPKTHINDILSCKSHYIEYLSSKYTGGRSPTIGFGFLMRLVEQNTFKKIVLVGYSNLDNSIMISKLVNYHDINAERLYYNTFIKDNYNIEIII